MGQCCSDISGSHDPDDMSLDFFNLSTTGSKDADEFYQEATGVLDEAVDVHNSVIDAIENLKMAGATMCGAYRPYTSVIDGRVMLTTLNTDGQEEDMIEKPSTRLKLAKELFLECQKTITVLNREGLGRGLSVRGGIKLVGQNCADHTVAVYNRQIYMYAKELMLLAGEINPQEYVNTLKNELGKMDSKNISFAVSCFDDGSLRIEASRFQASILPDGARGMLDALKYLEDEFRLRADEIPHLSMRLQYNVDAALVHVHKIEAAVNNHNSDTHVNEESILHARANLTKIEAGQQVIDNLVLTMKEFCSTVKSYLEVEAY